MKKVDKQVEINEDISVKDQKIQRLKARDKILLKSEKIRAREKKIRILKLALMVITLFLIIIYFLLRIFFESGSFAISLDQDFSKKSGIIMYENINEKEVKKILKAQTLDFMDNISIDWLPKDLNSLQGGSHNGDNYLAYTFYIENQGVEVIDYWYQIVIDDIIRNVDRAIRVMIYRNDEQIIYAKANSSTGNTERGTKEFYSPNKVLLEERQNFLPGQIDKFTVVVWIEGDDPDCVDELIGGQMKMHMEITEEHVSDERQNPTISNESI